MSAPPAANAPSAAPASARALHAQPSILNVPGAAPCWTPPPRTSCSRVEDPGPVRANARGDLGHSRPNAGSALRPPQHGGQRSHSGLQRARGLLPPKQCGHHEGQRRVGLPRRPPPHERAGRSAAHFGLGEERARRTANRAVRRERSWQRRGGRGRSSRAGHRVKAHGRARQVVHRGQGHNAARLASLGNCLRHGTTKLLNNCPCIVGGGDNNKSVRGP
mmetsp:Transcript_18074/g.68278  ORF Transcript_18074/g.68278 Transcript_18074/m.68278 type:complete len:219 (+) Transcript_18074:1393-2049(+)